MWEMKTTKWAFVVASISLLGLSGCAVSQSVGPDGVHQKAGPFEQSVSSDGRVEQKAGSWHQEVDSEGARQGHQ